MITRTKQRREDTAPDTAVRPFRIEAPEEALAELRRRVEATPADSE